MNVNSTVTLLVFIQFFLFFIYLQKRFCPLCASSVRRDRLQLSGNLCLCPSWWQEFAQEMNSPLDIEQRLLVWSGEHKRNSTGPYSNCLWSLSSSLAMPLILGCCLYFLPVNSRVVQPICFFSFSQHSSKILSGKNNGIRICC